MQDGPTEPPTAEQQSTKPSEVPSVSSVLLSALFAVSFCPEASGAALESFPYFPDGKCNAKIPGSLLHRTRSVGCGQFCMNDHAWWL